MRVVFTENTTPDLVAARTLVAQAADECFSMREVAEKTEVSLEEARVALEKLLETDWCFRVDTDKPFSPVLSPDERLGLRRHSLTVGREYDVLGIEADDYRILNDPESGRMATIRCSFIRAASASLMQVSRVFGFAR